MLMRNISYFKKFIQKAINLKQKELNLPFKTEKMPKAIAWSWWPDEDKGRMRLRYCPFIGNSTMGRHESHAP
jgi:hypothetical protein